MPNADRAFINAEQRCFDWIKEKLADIDGGITGFVGELPIKMSDRGAVVSERQMWCFGFTGQTETFGSNVGFPSQCHRVSASFRAMVTKRETALAIIGRLRTILPGSPGALVQRMNIESGMSLGRDTVELANDQERGGLYRVHLIDQPLWVQFSNDDELIGYQGNWNDEV